ncbi:hypothetical protein SteCoe_11665 [Stentor coeruleus]|uniref:Myosin motor domain-containing protein n=1 Tax=Stentor coeruleus TaxID=5963 RepID=A0A1R2CCK1_9CILI|nr:hypothetical protein SteCoe_11665 [Stentor coeruleus]
MNDTLTFAGPNLIHIEQSGCRIQLLLKYIEKLYIGLKNTEKTQSVFLMGDSLKTKEFDKTVIIQHLAELTRQGESISRKIQSAIELLSIFACDGENTYYSENIEISFDEKYNISGCKIKSRLTDLNITESCGIFRILLSQSDPALQHLGLSHRALSEKNIELHQKFAENLEILGITRTESQEIMELLAVTLLIQEAQFCTSRFFTAGQRDGNTYFPEFEKPNIKIYKLLGISQARFQEFFAVHSKQSGIEKLECFRKLLILIAFEALVGRINEGLIRKLGKGMKKNSIHILSFAGHKRNQSAEGILSNLILECGEIVGYEQLINLIGLFKQEKISNPGLVMPKCKYLIELFLDKTLGILYNFSNLKFWQTFELEVSSDPIYNKIINIDENLLTLNFSTGSNMYLISTVQKQLSLFPDATFYTFLKRCSHRNILNFIPGFNYFNYSSYIGTILPEIFNGIYDSEKSFVYCYKNVVDVIEETPVVTLVNVPYRYVIRKKLISGESLRKIGCKIVQTNGYYFIEKQNSEGVSKIFKKNDQAWDFFGIKLCGADCPEAVSLKNFINLQKVEPKTMKRCSSAKPKAHFKQATKTVIKTEGKDAFISIVESQLRLRNSGLSMYGPQATKIQAAWRGYKARKLVKSYKILNNSAKTIQKSWKGYKARKKFNIKKILFCIRLLQRLFRKRYSKKNKAAKVIQKFFLSKTYTKKKLSNSPYKASITGSNQGRYNKKNSEKLLRGVQKNQKSQDRNFRTQESWLRTQETWQKTQETNDKSPIRIQKSVERSQRSRDKPIRSASEKKMPTFAPTLSKKTQELALNTINRDYSNLKVEERLMLMEKHRVEKLANAIYKKKLKENPIKEESGKKVNKNFYEKQVKLQEEKKEIIKGLKDEVSKNELAECTFKPNLAKSSASRSPMETVQNLYNWNQKKELNRERQNTRNEFEMKLKMLNPKVLIKSEQLHQHKLQGDQEKQDIAKKIERSISPYWPHK